MLAVTPAAYSCSMAFPAYGVYSGGTALLGTYIDWNFALLMTGAILLKAVSYAFIGNGPKLRLMGAMIAGNLVTTAVGYLLEACHISLTGTVFLTSIMAAVVFHYAGKILWPLGYQARYPKLTLGGLVGSLMILYIGIGILALVITGTQGLGVWHWVLKWGFACASLIVALFVTTSYEYGVITRVTKQSGRDVFVPVLKANLIVFFTLFAAVAGVLWSQHKLPNP